MDHVLKIEISKVLILIIVSKKCGIFKQIYILRRKIKNRINDNNIINILNINTFYRI